MGWKERGIIFDGFDFLLDWRKKTFHDWKIFFYKMKEEGRREKGGMGLERNKKRRKRKKEKREKIERKRRETTHEEIHFG